MKIITIETLRTFLDELNRKYGTEFYSKEESDDKYQPKGDYATNNNVDKRMKAMIDILYPVGIVITTATDNTPKPGEAHGLAQWEEIGQNRVLQGCSTGAGSTIEAGLPNITGEFYVRPLSDGNGISWNETHGAITSKIISSATDSSGSVASGGNYRPRGGMYFNASKSNNIYGKSSTVQPAALKVHFWKRIK